MYRKNFILLRNLLVIPLIVGLIVAAFQYFLPKFLEKDNELSYSIEEPIVQLNKNIMEDVKVEIDDVETSLLVAQSVRIWNSGEIPIKTLHIRYVFETFSPTFKIFMFSYNTKPKYEFGKITSTEEDQNSKRLLYDLLNPGDEVTTTFLTNEAVPVKVYAKSEELSIKVVKPPERMSLDFIQISLAVISSLISILMVFLFIEKY